MVKFSDIPEGGKFLYSSETFIKLKGNRYGSALSDGQHTEFFSHTEVDHIIDPASSAEIVLRLSVMSLAVQHAPNTTASFLQDADRMYNWITEPEKKDSK